MSREYDIILYGASGYTAKYIIHHLENEDLKIALSARDTSKISGTNLPKIQCTIDNISTITSKTTMIINCVGPFSTYGEEIIKTCIDTKTHYVDICGETLFIKKMMKKYQQLAEENGVLIINACGFDSLPADMGTEYVKDLFEESKSVESTIVVKNPRCNVTTWKSLILSLKDHTKERQGNGNTRMKEFNYCDELKAYKAVFRGSDHFVVRTTQNLFGKCGLKTLSYKTYIKIGNTWNLFLYISYLIIIKTLAKIGLGRFLLFRFYRFFSCNIVQEHSVESDLKKSSFIIYFTGIGLISGVSENKNVIVSGPDPGYQTTSICVSQCALELISMIKNNSFRNHPYKPKGGVLTPAFVFKDTNLVERLRNKGLKFDVI